MKMYQFYGVRGYFRSTCYPVRKPRWLAAGMKMRFLLERTRGLKLHVSPPVGRSNTF